MTTSTLDIADLILQYNINPNLLESHRAAYLVPAIAWMVDGSNDRSNVHKFPRIAPAMQVPAGTKVELAQFTEVAFETEGVDATSGIVGFMNTISEEALQDGGEPLVRYLLEHERAMQERMSADLLALHTAAPNVSDFSGNALDLTNWNLAKTAFMAQNPNGAEIGFVCHEETFGQLLDAINTNGSGIINVAPGDIFEPVRGFRGRFQGVSLFASTDVPEFDATNWLSAFAVIGDLGAYGMVVKKPITHIDDPSAVTQAASRVVTSARYGVALTDPDNMRAVVTAKA